MCIGVAFQISGANWDIVWHGVRNVESFITPPHAAIYSGVALTIGSIIFRSVSFYLPRLAMVKAKHTNNRRQISFSPTLNVFKSIPLHHKSPRLPLPMKLAIIGAILQLTAGPFDYWWHSNFGFDGLLSPSHSILLTGMLMASLAGLFGIYGHYKDNSSSCAVKASLAVSFGVFLMVAAGMIFMFTLPFSKGTHLDFNPQPFAAIWAEVILIPFVMGLSLFLVSSSTKMPFIFTSITCVVITMQSSSTIISNSYFAGLFPFYILNILPALVTDVILILFNRFGSNNNEKNGNGKIKDTSIDLNKRYLIASILLSSFFITLFFPWTVYVLYGFFKPSNEIRTEEFLLQLLFPIILPVVIPVSLISSSIGVYTIQKLNSRMKTRVHHT